MNSAKDAPIISDEHMKTISMKLCGPDKFIDISNNLCRNIRTFLDEHGHIYQKYGNICNEFSNECPKGKNLTYGEHKKLFNNYKRTTLDMLRLSSGKLRKVICDYITERFYLMCDVYNVEIPYFTEESEVDSWFRRNCGYFFDLGIIGRHVDGIDYLCEYDFDPLAISAILKDENVSEFFYKFIDPDSVYVSFIT